MRADPVGQTRPRCGPLDRSPRLLAREPAASVAEEERPTAIRGHVADREQRRSRTVDPAREPVEGDVADRHQALLVALADDPDEGAVGREVLAIEPDRLADPQAGGIQQLEQGPVAEAPGLRRTPSPAASSRRSVSATVSVSGRSRDGLGRSRWAATSTRISPSP